MGETIESIRASRDFYKGLYLDQKRSLNKISNDIKRRSWVMAWGDFDYALRSYLRFCALVPKLHSPMLPFSIMWWNLGGVMGRQYKIS